MQGYSADPVYRGNFFANTSDIGELSVWRLAMIEFASIQYLLFRVCSTTHSHCIFRLSDGECQLSTWSVGIPQQWRCSRRCAARKLRLL